MSQIPDKIWLHKDTKYNTGDIVCGYQYDFAQGIEYEGIENFVEYVPVDNFIEKAVDYIANNMRCDGCTMQTKVTFIKEFKNYMKGE